MQSLPTTYSSHCFILLFLSLQGRYSWGWPRRKPQAYFELIQHPQVRAHPAQYWRWFRGLGKKGTCSESLSWLLQLSVTSLPPPSGCTLHQRPPHGSSYECQHQHGCTPAVSSPPQSTGRHPGECEGRPLPQILPSCWPAPRRGIPAGGTPRQLRASSSHRRTLCPIRHWCKPPPGPGCGRGSAAPSAAQHRFEVVGLCWVVSSSCAVPSSLLPSWAWEPCLSMLAWWASCSGSLVAVGLESPSPQLAWGGLQGPACHPVGTQSWPSAGDVALVFS